MIAMRQEFDVFDRDLIVAHGEVVMSRSEEPFLIDVFRTLMPISPKYVLEVGYGLGISAKLIQRFLRPQRHDIVEIEDTIFDELVRYSRRNKTITPIHGDWSDFKSRRNYDFIFLDEFNYDSEEFCYAEDDGFLASCKRCSRRLRSLLKPEGIVCILHFGHEEPDPLPGLNLVQFENL